MSDQNLPQPGSGNVYAPPEARVDDVVPEGEIAFAGRGTRLAAAIIDGILLGVINGSFAYVLGFNIFAPASPLAAGMQALLMLSGIGFFLLINGYLLAQNGQTVGKKLLNIKIVRIDGSKAAFGRIVGFRLLPIWIVSAIPYVGALVTVVDVLFIFRENHKCLHDNIADTVVVKC